MRRHKIISFVGLLLLIAFLLLPAAGWAKKLVNRDRAYRLMPEYNGIKVQSDKVKVYKELVDRLDNSARSWMTSSGLFLEDGNLDWFERTILKQVSKKKYQVWYLTSPRMLDGAGFMDVLYAWLWSFRTSPLDDLRKEMQDLTSKDEGSLTITTKAVARFNEIVDKSKKDPSLEIGLSFVKNFGKPRTERFRYEVPTYNTQLAMLGMLLNKEWNIDADRALIASSMVYGSVWTVADKQLRQILPSYSEGIVRRLMDDENNTDILAKSSVPSLLYLVWGAPGTTYPSYVKDDGIDSDGWYPRFAMKPMSKEDFEWISPNRTLLGTIKAHLSSGIGKSRSIISDIHDSLSFQDDKSALKWTVQYRGKRFRGSHVMNPEYYWNMYEQGLRIPGDSTDRSVVEILVARALGIPSLGGRFVIDRGREARSFTVTYDVKTDRFIAFWDDVEVRRKNRGVERIQIGFQKIPWDNFRFDTSTVSSMTRILNLETDEARVLAVGLPAGYLLRGRNPQLYVEY